MFDLKNLFGAAKPDASGWSTTMQYGKSPLSWTPDGQLAGFNMGGQDMGRALAAAGQAMPGAPAAAPGAFQAPPMPQDQQLIGAFGPAKVSATPQFRASTWMKGR